MRSSLSAIIIVFLLAILGKSTNGETALETAIRQKREIQGHVKLPHFINVDKKVSAECEKKKLAYNPNTRKCCPTTLHVFYNGKCKSLLPGNICGKGKVMNWQYHSCIPDNSKAAKKAEEKPVYNHHEKKEMKKELAGEDPDQDSQVETTVQTSTEQPILLSDAELDKTTVKPTKKAVAPKAAAPATPSAGKQEVVLGVDTGPDKNKKSKGKKGGKTKGKAKKTKAKDKKGKAAGKKPSSEAEKIKKAQEEAFKRMEKANEKGGD